MSGVDRLMKIRDLMLITAYGSDDSDKDAWSVIPSTVNFDAGVHVHNERVHRELHLLEVAADMLADRALQRLDIALRGG